MNEPTQPTDGVPRRSRRRSVLWALLLIVAVNLPTLTAGWMMDDAIHREMLTGTTADYHRGWLDLYCFSGGPKQLPQPRWGEWWQSPEMKNGCFFRPLSSLTLALDHTLLAERPLLAHLHGLLWSALTLGAIYVLAWKLFGRRCALLACIIYGIAGFGSSAVTWLAARHVLVTAALSGWGVATYVLGREDHRPARTALGLALLAFALLAGEGALGGFGFVVAYEVFRSRDSGRVRLGYASAATAAALAFVLWYSRSGHGTAGVGAYLDPTHHPWEFLRALPGRLVCLLGDAVLGSPSGLWSLSSKQPLLIGMGIAGLLLLGGSLALRPKRIGEPCAGALPFLIVGTLLAAMPGAAAIIGGRLLMLPAVGLAIVFAVALEPWSGGLGTLRGGRRLMARIILYGLGLGVLVLNPLARIAQTLALKQVAQREQQLLRSPLDRCRNAEAFLFLGTDDIAVGLHSPYLLSSYLAHKQWRQLTLATADLELTRLDLQRVRVRSEQALVLGGPLYELARADRSPLPAGSRFDASPVALYVESAVPAGVTALRLELPYSADDSRVCWLRYDGRQLVPFTLPAVGSSTTIPYAAGPMAF